MNFTPTRFEEVPRSNIGRLRENEFPVCSHTRFRTQWIRIDLRLRKMGMQNDFSHSDFQFYDLMDICFLRRNVNEVKKIYENAYFQGFIDNESLLVEFHTLYNLIYQAEEKVWQGDSRSAQKLLSQAKNEWDNLKLQTERTSD